MATRQRWPAGVAVCRLMTKHAVQIWSRRTRFASTRATCIACRTRSLHVDSMHVDNASTWHSDRMSDSYLSSVAEDLEHMCHFNVEYLVYLGPRYPFVLQGLLPLPKFEIRTLHLSSSVDLFPLQKGGFQLCSSTAALIYCSRSIDEMGRLPIG